MTHPEAIEYLYALRMFGSKFGLENMRRLASLFGNPERRLRFIHVAGTNGKGSTCAMLESVYRRAGLRTGLFTSPHLVSFGERIQVEGRPLEPDGVVRLANLLRDAIEKENRERGEFSPTFFEVVTMMALLRFEQAGCDLVVWETGMGGRLDSTNIVDPIASVVTNIQRDHAAWLGETLEQIAFEKAGILKPGRPACTGASDPRALAVLRARARELEIPWVEVPPDLAEASLPTGTKLPLAGTHQKSNAALAATAVRMLAGVIPVSEEELRDGLEATRWPGRFQVVRRGGQTVILDGAHNPDGMRTLVSTLAQEFPGRRPFAIVGVLKDKEWREMLDLLLPSVGEALFTPVESDRSADPAELLAHAAQMPGGIPSAASKNLQQALAQASGEPLLLVTGSLHFLGQAMELLGLEPIPAENERRLNESSMSPAPVSRFPENSRNP